MQPDKGKRAFLVCGEDDYRVEQTTRELLDALVPPASREFGLEVVDGRVETVSDMTRAFRAVRDALISDGLFGGGKTVWFREPAFLSGDKENRISKSEETKANAARLAEMVKAGLPEGSNLVVTALKINRGQGFFKAFSSAGQVFDLGGGFREWELRERAEVLLDECLSKSGLKMNPATREAFLSRVGTNSRQIASEIEKLAAYCGRRKTATEEDVADVVATDATSEIWDLSEAFASRDTRLFIERLERHYSQGESPIFIAQMLLGQVSNLLLLRDALDRGWASASGRSISWAGLPREIADAFSAAEKDPRKAFFGGIAQRATRNAALWRTAELKAARHHILMLREDLVSKQLPDLFMLETRLLQALGTRRAAK